MISFLAWVVGGILLLLSAIHIYWLLGGRKGTHMAVPSTGTEPLFRPSKLATGIVAVLLALACWFVFELGGNVRLLYSDSFIQYGGWILCVLFVLRAVGDFKWLGFFKRKKGIPFARWDSVLFSPLCLFLGIFLFIITDRG